MENLKKLFWSSRPISWVNTAYPFAVAYWLAGGTQIATLIIGALFFLVPYNLLMYGINDVFDYESDLRNPRKGGIEGALLDPKLHALTINAAVWSCLPFVIYLTVVGNSASTGWLYFFIFTVIAYSAKGLRFKEKPILDSLTSSSHFFGPMVVGLAMAGANLADQKLLAMISAFALWGIGSHAFGAVQDVKADREAAIKSIATVFGARVTTRLAFFAYLFAGLKILAAGFPATLASIAVIPYLVIVGRFWNITDETCEDANRSWKHFIKLNYLSGFLVTLLIIWYYLVSMSPAN